MDRLSKRTRPTAERQQLGRPKFDRPSPPGREQLGPDENPTREGPELWTSSTSRGVDRSLMSPSAKVMLVDELEPSRRSVRGEVAPTKAWSSVGRRWVSTHRLTPGGWLGEAAPLRRTAAQRLRPFARGYLANVLRFWAAAYRFDVIAAVVSVPLFAVAVLGGLGWRSLVILAAGGFWALMARFDRRRAHASARHHALYRRRRDRQSAGTWSGPHRD
jgi:hypothetical protein